MTTKFPVFAFSLLALILAGCDEETVHGPTPEPDPRDGRRRGSHEGKRAAAGFDAELGEVLSVHEGGASTRAYGVGNFDNNTFARVETQDDSVPAPGAIPLRVTLRVSYALTG